MPDIDHIEHHWITMSDGVRLSARLWLPTTATAEPVPAILEYIPYRKRDMVRIRDERNHPVFAQAGYAAIRVDMRGSGDSEGCMRDMYSSEELDDAIAVINWIARQHWCDGAVGMMGTSWGGTSSLQAASKRPPALKAVLAVCATNNRYDDDIHHMGGCVLTDTIEWGATLPAILASPPDPETIGSQWREIWLNRLEQLSFPLENWLAHETRDDYWQWGSINEQPELITCPVLMIGGWADRYSNTVMNFLEQSHDRCWGIVGPWGHHYPDQASPAPAIAFQHEAIQWWDYWLRGIDNGADKAPQLRVWMQEYAKPASDIKTRPGRWIAEPLWPSNNCQQQTYYLGTTALSRARAETGLQSQVPDDLRIGIASGDTGYFGRVAGLPLDQREDDEHALVFDSEPLSQALELLGSATISVALTRTQHSSMLVVRLSDVHSNGDVSRVSYGVSNLALNQMHTAADLQSPGKLKQVLIRLHNTAYRIEAGHRIRLSFSSSYWPMIWPSPLPGQITLLHDSLRLTLPTRRQSKVDEDKDDFDSPCLIDYKNETAHTHIVHSAPKLKRWTTTSDTLARSINWHQPLHSVYYPQINLTFKYETTAVHEITLSDPGSAMSQFKHTLHFVRDDWHVTVTGTATLTATESQYKLQGTVVVTENEITLFERQWTPTIARTC